MVYIIKIHVDGGCRANGQPGLIAGAAAAFKNKYDIMIYSDSRYAVNCITKWVYKWSNNGWMNSEGNEVANQDLIVEAVDLDDRLKKKGDVRYLCNNLINNMCGDRQSSSSDNSW
ncbi:ribonuclease H-like domain-containing protein [Aspergillus crustosus]